MEYISELTEEQRSKIPEYRDYWISKGLQVGDTDWETFEKYIPVCYEKAGIPFPNKIIRVQSPLVGALAASIASTLDVSTATVGRDVGRAVNRAVSRDVGRAVGREVSREVDREVSDEVYREVSRAVNRDVSRDVGRAVNRAVSDAVGGEVSDAVGRAVGGAVGYAVSRAVSDAVSREVSREVSGAVGGAVEREVSREVSGAVSDAVGGDVGHAVSREVSRAVSDAVGGDVGHAVSRAVDDEVGEEVGRAVSDAVDDEVGEEVSGAVGRAVSDAVDDEVGEEVSGAVSRAVSDAVDRAVDDAKWHYWLGGQFWVAGWYWGVVYCNYFFDVCGLKLSDDVMGRAEAYRKVCESVNYIWLNRKFIMVCARPVHIHRNDQGRLHSITEKAIEYPDGWGLYYVHGIKFSEEQFRKIPDMTAKDVLAIANIEQRTALLKAFGAERILDELDARLIDGKTDKDNELYAIDGITNKTEKLLKYSCPSTGRVYVKWVPPHHICADTAQASSHHFSLDEYRKLKAET